MNGSSEPIMVSIRCLVYNHEPYLRQCLEGLVMQKTNFPFEVIVHDDVSTDNSVAIIKEYHSKYPHIIKPIFEEENLYSRHDWSLDRVVDSFTRGKYVATCEGDDYWIDPNKLQMQVDFMESHPDYALCFTSFKRSDGIKHRQHSYPDTDYEKYLIEGENVIGTLTTMYRKSIYDNLSKDYLSTTWKLGDLPLWIELSHAGKVKYIDKTTAIYRILPNSASHSTNIESEITFIENVQEVKQFYNCKYGCKYKVIPPFAKKMKAAYMHNDKKKANIIAKESICTGYLDCKLVVFYFGTIIPGLRKIINLYY